MIKSIKNFFVGSFDEFKKIIWPNRKTVISHTLIVIISILVSMAIISVLDYGLFNLVEKVIMDQGV